MSETEQIKTVRENMINAVLHFKVISFFNLYKNKEWYNLGNSKKYAHLVNSKKMLEKITFQDIYKLAKEIKEYSSSNEEIFDIFYKICKKCLCYVEEGEISDCFTGDAEAFDEIEELYNWGEKRNTLETPKNKENPIIGNMKLK